MQLANTPRYSDPYGRYYTKAGAAKVLVAAMGEAPTGVVIELCAGNGALVGEASQQWKAAQFITVDIDKNAASSRLLGVASAAFSHHVADALDAKLPQKIGLPAGTAQSALCNPPYIKPAWQKHFGEILEEAELSGVFPQIRNVPADILFIAQNLRFLRPGGKLGLILPDGIIAGEKCSSLRQALASSHHMEKVIELPRWMFRGTEAKAYVVVLTKHGSQFDSIALQRLNNDGTLTDSVALPSERAAGRLDYSFHFSQAKQKSQTIGVAIRDIAEPITRGSFSSSQRLGYEFPVFHTTDFTTNLNTVPRRFLLSRSRAAEVDGVFARAGDILVARVGRNLEEKVVMVSRGLVVLSDCVLRIRVAPQYQRLTFDFLKSEAGRAALRAASHGVGAKFITFEALLGIVIRRGAE